MVPEGRQLVNERGGQRGGNYRLKPVEYDLLETIGMVLPGAVGQRGNSLVRDFFARLCLGVETFHRRDEFLDIDFAQPSVPQPGVLKILLLRFLFLVGRATRSYVDDASFQKRMGHKERSKKKGHIRGCGLSIV
jgi:hypothetical protein